MRASFPASPGGDARYITAPDGIRLRTAFWPGRSDAIATIILLGGRGEFIEKYHEVIGELLARNFAVWTFDWRGQGLSDRILQNRHKGHIDDYDTYLTDLKLLMATAVPATAPMRRIILGHSMGGHIALLFAYECPGVVEALVLSAPMVDINFGPIPRRFASAVASGARKFGLASSYAPGVGDYGDREKRFEGNPLTHDRRRFNHMVEWIEAKPDLALGGPTLGWLAASVKSIARLRDPVLARGIKAPVLIVTAAEDRIVCNAAHARFLSLLPSGQRVVAEGARHEVLMEVDDTRQCFWDSFDAFLSVSAVSVSAG